MRALIHSWSFILDGAIWLGLAGLVAGADLDPPATSHQPRVFASSRFSIDEILTRPFDRDVPMGSTGDRIWASSPQGWAFRDDVHWLDLTPFKSFDLEIRDEHGRLEPAQATYYPSHIHYAQAARKEMTASASFTFALDSVLNPLYPPFKPEKRWTCWSSGNRQDWYEVEFELPHTLNGFDLFFFDDAPSGGCRPPESFEVQFLNGEDRTWGRVELDRALPGRPKPGENRLRFQPVSSRRFRFIFLHAGASSTPVFTASRRSARLRRPPPRP